jgi:signal transduction histidine kinase
MLSTSLKDRLASFWTLQLAGWLAYWVMIYVTFLTVVSSDRMLQLLHVKTVRTIIGFGLTCVLRLIYQPAARKLSIRAIAMLALSGAIVFGCLWTLLEESYFWLQNPEPGSFLSWARFPKVALDYAMTVLAWSALYFGIKYGRAWQDEKERALTAIALAHQAQLEMLRYQLNPHFLFNALNSIRASIDEDSRRAKQMITEFSEFLRYSLVKSNAEKIPLRDELEAIRNYLAIETIRFESKLDVTFDIEPAAEEFLIPGFLVHPLVENAIKHGMTHDATPLKIRIKAMAERDWLFLEVANTGHLAKPVHQLNEPAKSNGTGIGLNNVRQRLQKLFPDRHRFSITEQEGWIRAVIEIQK